MTYNPRAMAFGYFKALLEWQDSGQILMTFNIQVGQAKLKNNVLFDHLHVDAVVAHFNPCWASLNCKALVSLVLILHSFSHLVTFLGDPCSTVLERSQAMEAINNDPRYCAHRADCLLRHSYLSRHDHAVEGRAQGSTGHQGRHVGVINGKE